MTGENPFKQDSSIRSMPENNEEGRGPKKLLSRQKSMDEEAIDKVDKVAIKTGWATGDEKQVFESESESVAVLPTVQLGVRVATPYLEFVKMVCSEKRQTKRVVIEQAIEAYCKEHGYEKI